MVSVLSILNIVVSGTLILCANVATGQSYPTKPVRVFTGSIGGSTDFVARFVARGIQGGLGQQVLVENRSARISGETVAKAPPDGYSLLLLGGAFWIEPLLQSTPYDVIRDFMPVSLTTRAPDLVVVHPSLPVKSIRDLITVARARAGEINYGSSGTGGSTHVGAELFKMMANVNMVRISYKGAGPAVIGLLSGEVQVMFGGAGSVTPHIKSGRLRAIAVTSLKPSALAPGYPTVAATVPGYESESIDGIFVPAGTPAPVVNRLNQEVVRFLKSTEAKDRLLADGSEPVGSSPEEFAAVVKSRISTLDKVIKQTGIKAD